MKGYVQVYTGNGKGKTTAALGLSIRAAGAGLKVYIAQFIKMGDYSEIKFLKERLADFITVEQYGLGRFTRGNPSTDDCKIARKGIEMAGKAIASGRSDLVILEEANVAVHYGMIPVEELLEVIDQKPEHVELVITGRYADPRVIERADLVTEMKKIKHYFESGVAARVGIEK